MSIYSDCLKINLENHKTTTNYLSNNSLATVRKIIDRLKNSANEVFIFVWTLPRQNKNFITGQVINPGSNGVQK